MTASSPGMIATNAPLHAFEWRQAIAVFLFGLAARLWLIFTFPIIFGGDSIVRLANSDRILLSYQLPLLQAAIHYLSWISHDAMIVRCFMAFAGALAGVACYALAANLFDRATAFLTALLFSSSPFVLAFSIVPYQEILMLAGLFAAFYWAFEFRWTPCSLALGLACLTRYEAWLACPAIALFFLLENGFHPRQIAKALVIFGWAPLTWIGLHGGMTPQGTFAAEAAFSVERFHRYLYLAWITLKNTPIPVLPLAICGLFIFWKRALFHDRRHQALLLFVGLFLVAVLLSAHGERDQPDRFVTAREAHILIAATILAAGAGLWEIKRYRGILVAVCVLVGLWMSHRFVAAEVSEPAFVLSYRAARYLHEHMHAGETAIVLARAIPEDLLARYLDKAEQSGGEEGRRKALEVLLDLDPAPSNYQRILVHSGLTKKQIRSVASLPPALVPRAHAEGSSVEVETDWLVEWSDFTPANAAEYFLAEKAKSKPPAQEFAVSGLKASIYRIREP